MNKRNLFALLLVLALMLSLLAGCGSGNSAATPAEDSSVATPVEDSSAETSATAADEVAPAGEEPAAEAEFNIYGPFSEEEIVLSYWKLWPPFLEGFDPMEASLFSTFYDRLNVRIEVTTIGTDAADTKFNLMVASGDYLDIIENAANSYSGGGTKAIADEVLIDMMPYMETYAPDYWAALQQDEIAMKTMIDANNQMASIVSLFDEVPPIQEGLWIRKDWMDEQNMSSPSSLEELEQTLDIFKNTYGCTDAFALRDDCDLPLHYVYNAFEWTLNDGQVVYGYTELRDNYKEYLKTAHDWYEKGYYSSGFITANDTSVPKSDMVVNGETGLFAASAITIAEINALDNNVEVQAVAPITMNADDMIAPYWNSSMNISNQASVSTHCEIPEIAIAYINYAFTEDAYMAVNWGIEGETYTIEDGEPVFTDLMLNNPNLAASFTPLAYISPGFPILKSSEMALSSFTLPAQRECFEIYASKIDENLPKTAYPADYTTLTITESETVANYESDIDTYVIECLAKFITGDMDVEKDYDTFADTLEEMGINEIKEIYQAAYTRFLG